MLVRKALLVLLCYIDASLKYIMDNDLTSGYFILRENANNIISRALANKPLTLGKRVEQRTVIIALDKIVKEYRHSCEHLPMSPDQLIQKQQQLNSYIDLHNAVLADHYKEEFEEPESREKIPAILRTASRGFMAPGRG